MIDVSRLNAIDWNFPGSGSDPRYPSVVNWFPGNFISQLPTALIQALSEPGDTVLDPFCGSGTTALAAMELGRTVTLSDQLPASLLVAEARIALARSGISGEQRNTLLAELTFDHQCRSDQIGLRGEGGSSDLHLWYSPDTIAQLKYIWQLIELSTNDLHQILVGIFSDILFQCASTGGSLTRTGGKRRHHWGWIADNVQPLAPLEHDAISMFRAAIIRASSVEAHWHLAPVTVNHDDARKLRVESGSIDLIVTSPPYIGMIDYTHASRMIYLWMGWSMDHDRQFEIGARYRRGRRRLRDEYMHDMSRCSAEMLRVLRPGRHCAVILGESRAFAGTALATFEMISGSMPLVWGPTPRMPSRRRVSDRQATDQVEYLAVFEKT